MVDVSLGEILVTAEKLKWTIDHGEEALKPERGHLAAVMRGCGLCELEVSLPLPYMLHLGSNNRSYPVSLLHTLLDTP